MALKIEWDKFEVALLIDACEKVISNQQSKAEVVSRLSSALRFRAQKNGIAIDSIFRNENGISLQMTKMDYLLTDGKIGLPGASKLYAEMAALRKNAPSDYLKILNVAKTQIVEADDEIKKSLDKTLDFLRTRYDVRLHFDRFTNPGRYSNDMLYKIRNSKKDIMWVYYIDTKSAHYISIETEPEYLVGLSENLLGFTRIKTRVSHPCRKFYFESFDSIKESLIAICDSIDMYFNDSPTSNQDERRRAYQRVYSISKVYDDPDGLDISKISSLVGSDISKQLIKEILDNASWATKTADGVYSFAKKSSNTSQITEATPSSSVKTVSESDFSNYLFNVLGLAPTTCRSYLSAIRTAEQYASEHNYFPDKIYSCSSEEALQVMQNLLNDKEFLELNAKQHNRFSASFVRISEFLGNNSLVRHSSESSKTEDNKQPTDFDKEKFEQTLLHRYRNGMQFDSIDYDIFREVYETLFDEKLTFDDSELEVRLRYCGVLYKDRLFPAEGIIDAATKETVFTYIKNSFSSGKTVLYYKAIYDDLAYVFSNCYSLSDENMLRAYLEYTAPHGTYFFFANYMSIERNITVNHNLEVEEYYLLAGKPVATETVCAALSHIPKEQVIRIIATDNLLLRNAKGEYFHKDIFEVSDAELNSIAEIINEYIEQNEYAIWTDVWGKIQETMPVFLENNLYLSWLGIRNVLATYYAGIFYFESAVISLPQNHYAMRDVYQLFAKHHSEFTADDIYNLSKELDTVIYFDALAEVSVRVSHDLFVSKNDIAFDVEAVDSAIDSYISNDFICIREIDSYLAFPNVGYEWNEYLLESFVNSYSNKYALLNNGFSLNNVAGAVVKREGNVSEFVDVCAFVLSDGPISLNKNDALNYLAEVNLISRRSYKDLELAIRKALSLRTRKG